MSSRDKTNEIVWIVYVVAITVLLIAGFFISKLHLYKAGDNIGYNMGLAGGIMMLVLLLYPLRKRVRFLENFGVLPSWFRWHMVLGILGPAVIVYHSTYQIRSINAGVAMACMLLVSGSGIFGRFFYTKIHRGLYGREANAKDIESDLNESTGVNLVLAFVPEVQRRLDAFSKEAAIGANAKGLGFARFVRVGIKSVMLRMSISSELGEEIRKRMQGPDVDAKLAKYDEMIRSYIKAVRDAAQFQTYERLFSLWHVFHIPLVYMLVFSAIYHVYAVNAY